MTRKALLTFVHIVSLILASFLIGCAMTRFINFRAGAIPDWMADSVRSVLKALRYQVIGIESLIDGSLLGKIVACWFLAALVMWAIHRFTREFIQRTSSFLAFIIGTFAGAYFLAHCIHGALDTPGAMNWLHDHLVAPSRSQPDNFQVLYVLGLLVTCWISVAFLFSSLLAIIVRRRSRPRHGIKNSQG